MFAVLRPAVDRARAGGGPTLIEAMTYRMESHTNADDATRYRSADEVASWELRDPIARLRTLLTDHQVLTSEPTWTRIDDEAERFAEAVRTRMNAEPTLDPGRPVPPRLRRADPDAGAAAGGAASGSWAETRPCRLTNPITMAAALNQALADSLSDDPTVLVLGEDVGTLGGVFRITDGLATKFGPDRVVDTPLAESGIVGTAIGMAMNGLRPVVEMQFDAFAYPAFEQITSHLAKLHNRTRGALKLPIVVRIPYGGGIGGVEHHSDSSEVFYTHTPGSRWSRRRRRATPMRCCGRPSPVTTR